MIAPSDPRPDDVDLDALVEFRVDPDARPGDVTAALARLLIDLARWRRGDSRKALAEQQAGGGRGNRTQGDGDQGGAGNGDQSARQASKRSRHGSDGR